jgi:AraC-like DNA-binding protein/mannose-6-phosphate isomerase-like protein (cupin superfamily)
MVVVANCLHPTVESVSAVATTEHEGWLGRLVEHPDVGLFLYGPTHRNWSVHIPRGLPEHLVYLVVAGACDGVADDQRIQLSPGSLMWLKPNVPFDLQATSPRPLTLYRFRLLPVVGEVAPLGRVVVLPDAWELRQPFDTLINELTLALPFREHRIRASMLLLFTAVLRLAERQHGTGHPLDPRQRMTLERYVDQHIGHRIRPADLAEQLNMSAEYFTRRFRQTFGVPPKVWLVRRRIQHAAVQLDEAADSIAQIATALGYPDVFLFSRQFKAVMGVSPTAYRAR